MSKQQNIVVYASYLPDDGRYNGTASTREVVLVQRYPFPIDSDEFSMFNLARMVIDFNDLYVDYDDWVDIAKEYSPTVEQMIEWRRNGVEILYRDIVPFNIFNLEKYCWSGSYIKSLDVAKSIEWSVARWDYETGIIYTRW